HKRQRARAAAMNRLPRHPALLLLILGGLLVSAAPASAGQTAPSTAAASQDFAGLVDIGGRRLFLECQGSGSPTVILGAGAGSDARIWSRLGQPDPAQPTVLENVARFTRVCAYDRPGTMLDLDQRSRSDPVPMPRTISEIEHRPGAVVRAD